MIIINKDNLAKHTQLKSHAESELAQRQEYNRVQVNHMQTQVGESLVANRNGLYGRDFWLELDRSAAEVDQDTRGREIYDDLQSLVTVLPLGKTVKVSNSVTGQISDSVKISMDGQSPFDFDQTGYGQEGTPIPMLTAGYGINFRHMLGLQTESIPLMVDSQRAKLEVFYSTASNYLLNGDATISEAGFKGMGIKNHTNTVKLDLGTTGANIDLTSASTTNDAIISYFTGAFSVALDNENLPMVDILWVSKEIAARLSAPFSLSAGFKEGTLMENILRVQPRIGDIKTAFTTSLVSVENAATGIVNGLSGNEFLAYSRSKSFIEIPTGQALQIVSLPRLMPRSNFNNDISMAFGVSVKKSRGGSGVFYASELT